MSKLHKNYTTPEQSMRLLELGVPADSADFRQPKDNGLNGREYIIFYNMFPFSKEIESTIFEGGNLLPCWSAGRLMEIYEICSGCKFERADDGTSIMQDAFETVYYLLNKLDFQKLEGYL